MGRFGTEEVIRPLSLTKIEADKTSFFFGEKKGHVHKQAESTKPMTEAEALRTAITAIKEFYADGNKPDYGCLEMYTDPTKKVKGISHLNFCTMKLMDK